MIMLDRPVERGGSSTRHREGAFWECRQLRGTIHVRQSVHTPARLVQGFGSIDAPELAFDPIQPAQR